MISHIRSYSFGFNGMEKLNEAYGEGNTYDFGARIYDPRIGRFLSIDPLYKTFPFQSPYCFAANSPIRFVDVDGKGPGDRIIDESTYKGTGNLIVILVDADMIDNWNKEQMATNAGNNWDYVVVTSLTEVTGYLDRTYKKDGNVINNLFIRTHGGGTVDRGLEIHDGLVEYFVDDGNGGEKHGGWNYISREFIFSDDLNNPDNPRNDVVEGQVQALENLTTSLGPDANIVFGACGLGYTTKFSESAAQMASTGRTATVAINFGYCDILRNGNNGSYMGPLNTPLSNATQRGWNISTSTNNGAAQSQQMTNGEIFLSPSGEFRAAPQKTQNTTGQ